MIMHFISYQSYDTKFLKTYRDLKPSPLQLEEDLEQLKVLENGYRMKVCYKTDPLLFLFAHYNFTY